VAKLGRWLLWAGGALVAALLVVVLLVLERTPRVVREVAFTPDQIGRAKRIVDTQRALGGPGRHAVVRVLPGDADTAANYAAYLLARGSARVALAQGSARVQLSLPLGGPPPLAYLNVETTLVQTIGLPWVTELSIGRLSIPDAIVDWALPRLLRLAEERPDLRMALATFRQVRMAPSGLTIIYRWPDNSPLRADASVFSAADRERLQRYQTALANESRSVPANAVPLVDVLGPLLRLAAERSAGGDAVAENRALILVATAHALGIPLHQILPEAAGWPRPQRRNVTLDGRDDLAKHFLLSAAIAAYADTVLADAIGLYKELEDARHGSGFSFPDLAADRAGTRFGERAVAGGAAAARLHAVASDGFSDADLMPAWRDLPEGLPEREFQRRFGGIDAPAYLDMVKEVDRRVAELRVLR
jgi:hypothetical protein